MIYQQRKFSIQLLLPIIILLFGYACKTEKAERQDQINQGPIKEMTFDKTKWNIKEGEDFPYRVQMLNDVLYNDTIRSLNKKEILDLLGEPSNYRNNEDFLYYKITENGIGSWTLKTKTMVIKFLDENTIDWIKIHE